MRKLFVRPLAAALVVVVAACSAPAEVLAQSEVSAEEYAVYSAFVTEAYLKPKTELAVIASTTSAGRGWDEMADLFLNRLPSLSRATLDDFVARNDGERRLSRSFTLKAKYVLVEYGVIEKLFGTPVLEEAWKTFYERYPASNGYVVLSRVGFNPAKDQALVYVAWMCNERCGEGKVVLLSKREGRWKIENHHLLWVS